MYKLLILSFVVAVALAAEKYDYAYSTQNQVHVVKDSVPVVAHIVKSAPVVSHAPVIAHVPVVHHVPVVSHTPVIAAPAYKLAYH